MVEDSSMDAELTLMRLERNGLHIEARQAFDHVGAEHALREELFDLILCDCVLPSSSGTEVLAIAQRLAPDVPFIFLSGNRPAKNTSMFTGASSDRPNRARQRSSQIS